MIRSELEVVHLRLVLDLSKTLPQVLESCSVSWKETAKGIPGQLSLPLKCDKRAMTESMRPLWKKDVDPFKPKSELHAGWRPGTPQGMRGREDVFWYHPLDLTRLLAQALAIKFPLLAVACDLLGL